MRRETSNQARRRAGALAIVAVVITAALGCLYGPDANITFTQLAARAKDQNMFPWFCRSTGLGGHMSHTHEGGLANPAYAGKVKGDLSWDDCTKVAALFDKTRAATAKWPTRGDAERDGFTAAAIYIPGLGTHHQKGGWTTTGVDPEHPNYLQYDGEGPDARLVGATFVEFSGDKPPPGFPGDNDWWHTHSSLCTGAKGLRNGDEISDEECTSHGGTQLKFPGMWMLHTWIFPGYEMQQDVFSGFFGCVKGRGPATDPKDPCHRNDPVDFQRTMDEWWVKTDTATVAPTTVPHAH